MRFIARIFSIVSFLLLFGCASYTLEPLTESHPAHPKAAVATIPRASQTLAYTAADLPSRSAVADQGGHDAHHGSDAPAEKTTVGEGKVIAVGSGRVLDDGTVRALGVEVGQTVIYSKYGGTEIKLDGKEYTILDEDQVYAIKE